MNDNSNDGATAPQNHGNGDGLSYKFQRLRERLRSAIASGDLSGKLPGERTLAKRFEVNAKTLSKALTDLAAEGLLDRTIGRGTYVRTPASASPSHDGANGNGQRHVSCLIVCEAERADDPVIRAFRAADPSAILIHDVASIRPSFLRQFDAVLDFGRSTPETFLRGLIVRNMPLVAVDREPGQFSITTVAVDRALGAANVTRELCLAGHHTFAVLESVPRGAFADAVRTTAARYAPKAKVSVCPADQVADAVRAGATAVISDCPIAARAARVALEADGRRLPADVSLAAVGCADHKPPCSGHYADPKLIAQTVVQLLHAGLPHRPATIWLAPQWSDHGSTAPAN